MVFEIDELCTCVGNKKNKAWVWIVMHCPTRQILAYKVGDRSQETLSKLWNMMPPEIRENGLYFTDAYTSFACAITPKVHCPQEKRVNKPHIEHCNETFRAMHSRTARNTYSFFKSFNAIVGAVAFKIYSYNRSIRLSTPQFSTPKKSKGVSTRCVETPRTMNRRSRYSTTTFAVRICPA